LRCFLAERHQHFGATTSGEFISSEIGEGGVLLCYGYKSCLFQNIVLKLQRQFWLLRAKRKPELKRKKVLPIRHSLLHPDGLASEWRTDCERRLKALAEKSQYLSGLSMANTITGLVPFLLAQR